jgi:hypothetical protein
MKGIDMVIMVLAVSGLVSLLSAIAIVILWVLL